MASEQSGEPRDGPVWMPKALYELKPARGRTWTLTPLSQVQEKGCRDAL